VVPANDLRSEHVLEFSFKKETRRALPYERQRANARLETCAEGVIVPTHKCSLSRNEAAPRNDAKNNCP
jgi:hypothetical protein